jgi:hypothetical protein
MPAKMNVKIAIYHDGRQNGPREGEAPEEPLVSRGQIFPLRKRKRSNHGAARPAPTDGCPNPSRCATCAESVISVNRSDVPLRESVISVTGLITQTRRRRAIEGSQGQSGVAMTLELKPKTSGPERAAETLPRSASIGPSRP